MQLVFRMSVSIVQTHLTHCQKLIILTLQFSMEIFYIRDSVFLDTRVIFNKSLCPLLCHQLFLAQTLYLNGWQF